MAYVNNDCVGCGVCGENAHAAILCPSFYRAELIYNPSFFDRLFAGFRGAVIGAFQRWGDANRVKHSFGEPS